MQVSEYYIPATQTYSKMEPAFTQCDGKDYIIPFALGAVSRAIGGCQERHGDTGTCWGTFHSRDVDTRDTPWGCISNANVTTSVCRVGAASEPEPALDNTSAAPSSHTNTSTNSNTNNNSQHILRTLKGYQHNDSQMAMAATMQTRAKNEQASNLFMSYDAYDKPFLDRGLQSTSDPAGWLNGVPTFNNLMQRAEASTLVPAAPWGVCSSYGNYQNASNSVLTSNNKCGGGGNCILGQYA